MKKTYLIGCIFIMSMLCFILGMGSLKEQSNTKLGATFPLSGEVASAGQRIRNGIELAVSEVNEGRKGPKVEVIFEDDQNKPAMAVGNAKKLIDIDHVVAILGSAASGCTRAIMPFAIERKAVVLSPISSSVSLSKEGGDFFSEWLLPMMFRQKSLLHGSHNRVREGSPSFL